MKTAILDTNSVVQSLISESPILLKAEREYDKLILETVVLVEATYVLEKTYKLEREEIVTSLRQIVVQEKIEADRALYFEMSEIYRTTPNLSAVDCYVFVRAKSEEIDIITSDKKLLKKYERR
jgi:predicted nucleic-acid-binding protein